MRLLYLELHGMRDGIARDLEIKSIGSGRVTGRRQVELILAAGEAEIKIGT